MRNKILMIMVLFSMMTGIATAASGAVFAVNSTGYRSDFKLAGTAIYIDGQQLPNGATFTWVIRDMDVLGPGGEIKASGSSGNTTTVNLGDSQDAHIFPYFPTGWTIPNGDYNGHKYRLDVTFGATQMSASFTKKDSFETEIPEFPTVALPIAAVIGLVFFFQHKKKKEE